MPVLKQLKVKRNLNPAWGIWEEVQSWVLLHETGRWSCTLQGSRLGLCKHGHEGPAYAWWHWSSLLAPLLTGALRAVRMLITECPSLLVIVLPLVSVHLLNVIIRSTYIFPASKVQRTCHNFVNNVCLRDFSLLLALERCILIMNVPGIDFPVQAFTPK